jgi:Domain of unknown function (DUF4390)
MQAPLVRRRKLLGLVLGLLCCLSASLAQAQGIELAQLEAARNEGALTLEFAVRITLPKAVEEALHRGVPAYFVAEAQLKRNRWYWRDEVVSRVARNWRIAYQPLTSNWRVGLGALNQSYPTLPDAVAAVSRSAGWKIADLAQIDAGSRYYVEFNFRLDTSQLPGPMQIGLGGPGDWAIGAERVLRLEPEAGAAKP